MDRRLFAFAALVAAFAGLGLTRAPGLLGYGGAEVYGHAWVQWWHAAALPGWPAGTALALGTERWPVIDPLPTALAAAIGRVAGGVAGYDAWILLAVAGAFLGGAWLARREGGVPVVGGLALALAAPFVGSLASGLTEDGAVGLAAVGLGLVGARGRGALACGLSLGLLAWCGLALAWYAAVAAVGLGVAAVARDRGAWRAVAVAGIVAAVVAAPSGLLLGDRLLGAGHRAGEVAAAVEPLWRLNPWRGVDVLSLVAPGPQSPGGAFVRLHPGYLGLVPLALAVAGGWSRWWGVLLGAAALSLGPELSFGGEPLGVSNPVATLAHALPGGALLNHHGRALLVGAVALSALAARGAARVAEWAGTGAAVPAILAADLLFLSPLSLPLPVADARTPDVASMLDGLSPGAVLPVPTAGPGVHPQRALFDQRAHGRPLLLSPNRPGLPDAVARTDSGRWLSGLAFGGLSFGGLAFGGARQAPDALSLPGVAVLLVAEPYVGAVAAVAGPPDVVGEDGAAWDLAAR